MLKKNCCLVLILMAILFLPSISIFTGHGAETVASSDKVLTFLKDVVRLDLSKYRISLTGPTTNHPEDLGGLEKMVGFYTLQSETSTLEVLFSFVDGNLSSCLLSVRSGVPQYIEAPPNSNAYAASEFLKNYEAFTGDLTLQTMRNMLDTVDATKNATKASDNLLLTVMVDSSKSIFNWKNAYNEAVFSQFGVTFHNQIFSSFGDDRSYLKIGSTDVNLSREEAVNMALNLAKNYSWSYRGEKISNFTMMSDLITSGLYTKGRDAPLVLYPYWLVTMPLDDVYPGFVTMVEVQIWADTSELISIYTLGFGGGSPVDASPITIPSSSTQPTHTPTSTVSPSPLTSPITTESPVIFSSVAPSPSVSEPAVSRSPQPTSPPSLSPSIMPTESPLLEPTGIKNGLNVEWLGVGGAVVMAIVVMVGLMVMRQRKGT